MTAAATEEDSPVNYERSDDDEDDTGPHQGSLILFLAVSHHSEAI